MDFDERGWALGRVLPLALPEAFTLLSAEREGRFDAARWAGQATRFFGAKLRVVPDKHYPAGTLPLADAAELEVERGDGASSRVFVVTLPEDRVPGAREAALEAARALGGAGMDALAARARRIWQVRAEPLEGDPRASLAAAAILASVLLAPIVPPGQDAIFGVKGARERLERLGW